MWSQCPYEAELPWAENFTRPEWAWLVPWATYGLRQGVPETGSGCIAEGLSVVRLLLWTILEPGLAQRQKWNFCVVTAPVRHRLGGEWVSSFFQDASTSVYCCHSNVYSVALGKRCMTSAYQVFVSWHCKREEGSGYKLSRYWSQGRAPLPTQYQMSSAKNMLGIAPANRLTYFLGQVWVIISELHISKSWLAD